MTEYAGYAATAPNVIVVGDQRLADALATCGAQWTVYPAAPTVAMMWDALEAGALPNDAAIVVFADGAGRAPDELESSLVAFAPYAATFLFADPVRGPQLLARARALAPTMEGGDPNAPMWLLPTDNLPAALDMMRQALSGRVAWIASGGPTYGTPAAAPAPAYPAAAAAPAAVPAPAFAAAAAPAAAPAPAAGGGYAQAAVYPSMTASQAAHAIAKRPDALPGQMTIACMSSKGGSGKSTTALCLAGVIARSSAAAGDPKRVVVVDLDTRDGQVGSLIGQYMPTSVSIRVMPKWDQQTVLANLVHDKRLGVDALLAPVRPRNADDVGPDFYRQIIQVLQTTHDVVILDCSVNYLDPLLGIGFALADEILFVTTLATTSVQGMARSLTELFAAPAEGGLGISPAKVGVVANQVINNVGMGKDKLLRAALGAPLVGQIPAEHDAVLIATNSNRMADLLKHPRLGPAYFKLASNCLPGWRLAPLAVEAGGPTTIEEPAQAQPQQRKGFFGR